MKLILFFSFTLFLHFNITYSLTPAAGGKPHKDPSTVINVYPSLKNLKNQAPIQRNTETDYDDEEFPDDFDDCENKAMDTYAAATENKNCWVANNTASKNFEPEQAASSSSHHSHPHRRNHGKNTVAEEVQPNQPMKMVDDLNARKKKYYTSTAERSHKDRDVLDESTWRYFKEEEQPNQPKKMADDLDARKKKYYTSTAERSNKEPDERAWRSFKEEVQPNQPMKMADDLDTHKKKFYTSSAERSHKEPYERAWRSFKEPVQPNQPMKMADGLDTREKKFYTSTAEQSNKESQEHAWRSFKDMLEVLRKRRQM